MISKFICWLFRHKLRFIDEDEYYQWYKRCPRCGKSLT